MARPFNISGSGLIVLALTWLSACVHSTDVDPNNTPAANCRALFQQLDLAVSQQRVQDSQQARITGYPYLRSNRVLAALKPDSHAPQAWQAWIEQLQNLGLRAWELELLRLTPAARQALRQHPQVQAQGDLAAALRHCSDMLIQQDLRADSRRAQLRHALTVPDAYHGWRRVVGLYPLIALPVAYGIRDYHQQTHARYALAASALPQQGQLLRYQPPPQSRLKSAQVAAILERSRANPLALPLPDAADRERLFASFAPSWELDIAGEQDRIGAPVWRRDSPLVQLDLDRPTVYRLLSHTLVQGQVLLQLNYIVWFPARARSSRLDLLGGHLDGITWRVTLTPQGEVLLYDTMHNCGCYHMFYPSARLAAKPNPGLYQENPLIPQLAPALAQPQGMVLRVAHNTHYIERIGVSGSAVSDVVPYRWDDYDSLRALPYSQDRQRSLFGAHGLVAGTDRAERYLFWPLGVASAGAMRQWGQHATAFLGRRHFDDPDLIERYFDILPAGAAAPP